MYVHLIIGIDRVEIKVSVIAVVFISILIFLIQKVDIIMLQVIEEKNLDKVIRSVGIILEVNLLLSIFYNPLKMVMVSDLNIRQITLD